MDELVAGNIQMERVPANYVILNRRLRIPFCTDRSTQTSTPAAHSLFLVHILKSGNVDEEEFSASGCSTKYLLAKHLLRIIKTILLSFRSS